MLTPGPPLDPTADQAHDLLRRELLHSEYHTHDIVQQLLDWVDRLFSGAVDEASGASLVPTFVALLVLVVLLVGLLWLLSRLRVEPRRRAARAALLTDDRPTAAQLRRRAEEALRQGLHDEAVVDGFRALATRQIERGRLDDQPGATAHEVAARLAASYPQEGPSVGRTADLFDATLYGGRPATHDEAGAVLELDDVLAGAR